MREGWKEVRIADLGQVVTGNTPPKKNPENYGGKYPFIKPTDMEVGKRYVTNWDENYSEKAYQKYKNAYIPPGSTGVVTIGTVGEKLFQTDQYCFTNQSVNVVIPNENYDPDFIFYLMKINLPQVENANPGTASGRHHVSKSNFCAIKVNVPESKQTQQKIAAILSAYDDLIENNLKRIKLLEAKAQLTYEEWFVRLKFPGYETAIFDGETGLPEGWERRKLGEIVKNHDSKRKPISKINRLKRQGKYPYYGAASIMDYIDDYLFDGRFVLMGEDGTVITKEGTPMLQFVEGKIWVNNHAHVLEGVDISNEFLYLFLNQYSISGHVTGVAQPKINQKNLNRIDILLGTLSVMKSIDQVIKPIYDSVFNLTTQNQHLKEARDILLPRLMMGLIDVDKIKMPELETMT